MQSKTDLFRIADAASLIELRADISSGRRQLTRRGFVLDLKTMPKERQAVLETRLNGAYFDCACQSATVGGFLAFAAAGAFAAFRDIPPLSLTMAATVIGAFFAGVAAGKIAGRMRQARSLKAIVGEVIAASGLSREVNGLSSYGDGSLCAH